jgi:hypothetical protein
LTYPVMVTASSCLCGLRVSFGTRTIDVILLAIGATGSEDQEKRSFAFASSAEIVRSNDGSTR